KHKTQVYLSPGDHYRTRLTHSMEVSQISRTIGRALRLNEDMIEAAALGHDLGHTPFGHAGERAINKYTGHFTHNEQSIRVVTYYGRQGRGLNLTAEVQDAILCHTGEKLPGTLEGAIVRRCDRICYLCSDLDDSIRVGLAGPDKLPGIVAMRLGTQPSQILDILVHNIVECSAGKDKIILDSYYDEAVEEFRDFMFAYVYECPALEKEHQKAEHVIMSLLDMYEKEPQLLPEDVQLNFDRFGKMTAIVDYVAGLTDLSAVRMFNQHFVPKVSE
ncbi:MAG: HD domain-containing protein, partial [Acidaminococcaceae bacterium]|nr:HD domain-containing protein [Acidaminococcaceae bacterium]